MLFVKIKFVAIQRHAIQTKNSPCFTLTITHFLEEECLDSLSAPPADVYISDMTMSTGARRAACLSAATGVRVRGHINDEQQLVWLQLSCARAKTKPKPPTKIIIGYNCKL